MRKKTRKLCKCIGTGLLALTLAFSPLEASASTISQVKDKISQTQQELEGYNEQISDLTDEQDLILEQMDDLQAEIQNLLTTIGLLEDEIAQKEDEIAVKEQEYAQAKLREEAQKDAMTLSLQLMYEKGSTSLIDVLLGSGSFGQLLNGALYVEQVYQYDRDRLAEYVAAKEHVQELWDALVEEKAGLEEDRKSLQDQEQYCEGLKRQLKKQADNYDALIAQATKSADEAKKQLKKEQDELKRLQEEERQKQAAAAAANIKVTNTSYSSIVDNASGSDQGKKIAKYALQFVGNPYVAGGTSLTKGADCSGFTYRVYKDFGYSLPRTSYQQRSAGKSVAYADAQPGDLICYEGHVGMYIGGGYIVHASSAKTGIKVSKANYRTILAVRRIL